MIEAEVETPGRKAPPTEAANGSGSQRSWKRRTAEAEVESKDRHDYS